MKRAFTLFLSLIMLVGVLSGCQGTPAANANGSAGTTESTTAQDPVPNTTLSEEQKEPLKLLIIGNSHSECSADLLYEVFKKEAPEKEVVLGVLYYSGCHMSTHAEFIKNVSPEYIYHKNTDGKWVHTEQATVLTALQDEQWDVVSLQQMNHQIGIDAGYVAEDFMTVINYVYDNQEVNPKLVFHAPWANPDDPVYWDMNDQYYISWVADHNTWYPDADGKYNNRLMYDAEMKMVQKYLVDTNSFLGKNYFEMIVPTATVIQYAKDVLNRPYGQLYRDWTHLSDYGRLMVAYYWYAKLMGFNSISQVNVDKIPSHLHQPKSSYPGWPTYEVSQDMKTDIIKAVNWALEHPYEVPAK